MTRACGFTSRWSAGEQPRALAVDPLSLDAVEGGEPALLGLASAGTRPEGVAAEIAPVRRQSTGPWAADTDHVRPAVAQVHEASALHCVAAAASERAVRRPGFVDVRRC
jgi:hypothetical protein